MTVAIVLVALLVLVAVTAVARYGREGRGREPAHPAGTPPPPEPDVRHPRPMRVLSEIPRPAPRRRPHVPSPVPTSRHGHTLPLGDPPDDPPRLFAERFHLPPSVHAELRHRDDPVELVRAILAAAGLPAAVDGEWVSSGDHLIAVIGSRSGKPALPRVLNGLYLSFRASGARHGVVLCLDHLDPAVIRRRELLETRLGHEGPAALQRMADAVGRGEDPLEVIDSRGLAPVPMGNEVTP